MFNITYHLQFLGTRADTIGAPAQAVKMAGEYSIELKIVRFLSVVVSAASTCCINSTPFVR